MSATDRLRWMKRLANRQERQRARRTLRREQQPPDQQHRHSAKWRAW